MFCSSGDDNTSSVSRSMGEYSPFPVLVSHMMERAMTSSELYAGQWSFREMLDKLLSIAALPVKQAMKKVRHCYNFSYHTGLREYGIQKFISIAPSTLITKT